MKIHSDKLTDRDIHECVPDGCYLAVQRDERDGWYKPIMHEGSRKRARGFIVRLSGSHKVNMRNLDDKAATYAEWGNFIAALFQRDPDAICGSYAGAPVFHHVTHNEFLRDPLAA